MAKGKRVLIVDDHLAIREVMRSVLEREGFEVWEAADGAEGVQKAQDIKPDLIILDLLMPVMNGFETARALKKAVPHIPLMMFTESEMAIVGHQAESAGIVAVALKSEGTEPLLKMANELLNRRAAAASNPKPHGNADPTTSH
jgi:CheY-like chemotaxis protein